MYQMLVQGNDIAQQGMGPKQMWITLYGSKLKKNVQKFALCFCRWNTPSFWTCV